MSNKSKERPVFSVSEERTNWTSVIIAIGVVVLLIWFIGWLLGIFNKADAVGVCEAGKYCADWNWNHTQCEDWDYRLCHTNPSHTETLNFNNLTSCNNHLGTPHNSEVEDTAGVCVSPTPTPTGTPNPTPTPTPEATPTPEPECEKDCEPTPTPEVTPTPTVTPGVTTQESKPEGCTHDCGVPACTDTTPQPVVNPHIYRSGSCAIVKYWPTSDKVNLYWKEVSSGGWQHALANQPATGNHEICALSGDVTFGVQSVSGCAADGIVNASNISEIVDGDTHHWVLFR